ncbi:MAG: hypothetical protein EXR12_00240 [Rhodospirillaceae bacterium]|nr:hypothetical protein [Rhodospirillaceae bacterium]
MKKLSVASVGALAACLLASLLASPGHAESKTLAQAGSWKAFGGTTQNGRGVCGISAEPGGRYFGLKLFAGDNAFTIQMGTKAWKLTDDGKVEMTMQFDAHPAWRARGTAFHFADGDAGLQVSVNRNELDRYQLEFRNSSQLQIKFKGVLPDWRLGLEGTSTVNAAFQTCVRNLK